MSDLLKINVNDHTERKGQLVYLSWAWAWAEVLKLDPAATWDAHEFGMPPLPAMFLPDGTAIVKTTVTIGGKSKTCLLPVMDNRNKAIKNPDAFAINTATMRCMTKAVSMHGLGLYIYAGEDLPEGEEAVKHVEDEYRAPDKIGSKAPRTVAMQVRERIQSNLANGLELGALQEWQGLESFGPERHKELASMVWSGLTTPEQNEIRRLQNEARDRQTLGPGMKQAEIYRTAETKEAA